MEKDLRLCLEWLQEKPETLQKLPYQTNWELHNLCIRMLTLMDNPDNQLEELRKIETEMTSLIKKEIKTCRSGKIDTRSIKPTDREILQSFLSITIKEINKKKK